MVTFKNGDIKIPSFPSVWGEGGEQTPSGARCRGTAIDVSTDGSYRKTIDRRCGRVCGVY